jgi:pyridoxine 4-dehydrogenase
VTSVASAGQVSIGGDLNVSRIGFGTMQLTGPGIWGPPADRPNAVKVLRRAVELGVQFIDTADSYGPGCSEELIRESLSPYPSGVLVATKAGQVRTGPDEWHPLGRPEYLRQQCELSLRRLGVETIGLFQLHRVDPSVPLEDQVGVLRDLSQEGKVRYIGLSEISVGQLKSASVVAPIASVQNLYNVYDRDAEPVLRECERMGIAFIPWFPLGSGEIARVSNGPLAALAKDLDASPSQVALAWLLARSELIMPIPGTSSLMHLEENCSAGSLHLSTQQFEQLARSDCSSKSREV